MNTRPLNPKKYCISNNRFRELYYFCLQYQEWKDELEYLKPEYRETELSGMPGGGGISNPVQDMGIRRAELSKRCELIEQTAIEADPDIYQYIIKAVTNEKITFKYLKMIMGIPCERDMYYDRRRRFYWLLSKKI